jgi:hypothetical protein
MNTDPIIQRLEELHNVLAYCSDIQNCGRIYVFKVAERICINQERGALFSQLSHANNETFSHEVREYKIPAHIEAKVKFTINKIHATNWGGHKINEYINL